MSRYHFYTADVFTNHRFGGNPLAVLTNARGLDTETMRAIAREFNYSETVFVLPPENPAHTRRLRIFTPGAEMPFAGHPTVGTAFILASCGELVLRADTTGIIFEEGVGPVPVSIRSHNGQPTFTQLSAAKMPEFGPQPPSNEAIASVFSLQPDDLLTDDFAPQSVSCGVPFLFVPVRNREVLARLRLNTALWEQILKPTWAPEVFLFAFDPELPGSDLHARMFAPALGLQEDPATGAAATALAGYLGARAGRSTGSALPAPGGGTLRWVVEQGFEMGRPSILEVELDQKAGQPTAIRVGGASILVSEGWIEV
jgi:trans-2,3-dihydro-3-hydroxyanthranilate isomerase